MNDKDDIIVIANAVDFFSKLILIPIVFFFLGCWIASVYSGLASLVPATMMVLYFACVAAGLYHKVKLK